MRRSGRLSITLREVQRGATTASGCCGSESRAQAALTAKPNLTGSLRVPTISLRGLGRDCRSLFSAFAAAVLSVEVPVVSMRRFVLVPAVLVPRRSKVNSDRRTQRLRASPQNSTFPKTRSTGKIILAVHDLTRLCRQMAILGSVRRSSICGKEPQNSHSSLRAIPVAWNTLNANGGRARSPRDLPPA
jgi:hypothetical protein